MKHIVTDYEFLNGLNKLKDLLEFLKQEGLAISNIKVGYKHNTPLLSPFWSDFKAEVWTDDKTDCASRGGD